MHFPSASRGLSIGDTACDDSACVPVITYHSIDDSGSVISTSPQLFHRQMKLLRDSGYRSLTLEALFLALEAGKPVAPRSVVITFDDGFLNFYADAFPILAEHGLSATVFVVTGHCGGFNDWDGNPAGFQRSRLLSWEQIKELSSYGIEFGSHTLSHPNLMRLPADTARMEIEDSSKAIEDATGIAARSFAYPFGSMNSTIKRMVRDVYDLAFSTHMGKVSRKSDLYALERIDAYYLSNLRTLSLLPTRTFDSYLAVREFLRSLKGAASRA